MYVVIGLCIIAATFHIMRTIRVNRIDGIQAVFGEILVVLGVLIAGQLFTK